jgi:hypothetical protein
MGEPGATTSGLDLGVMSDSVRSYSAARQANQVIALRANLRDTVALWEISVAGGVQLVIDEGLVLGVRSKVTPQSMQSAGAYVFNVDLLYARPHQ